MTPRDVTGLTSRPVGVLRSSPYASEHADPWGTWDLSDRCTAAQLPPSEAPSTVAPAVPALPMEVRS